MAERKRAARCLCAAGIAVAVLFAGSFGVSERAFVENMRRELWNALESSMYRMFMPCIVLQKSGNGGMGLFAEQLESLLPGYAYLRRESAESAEERSLREILLPEGEDETGDADGIQQLPEEAEENGQAESGRLPEEAAQSETLPRESVAERMTFLPHLQQAQLDLEALRDYETLLKQFYTVDANTSVGSDRLNVEALLGKDMRIDGAAEGPQILIYHTHSLEAFADSVPGDPATTIVGVGERLAEILRETYGYEVLHHTAEYDTVRNEAYSKALPKISRLLEENPSIQVVIDLHRDAVAEETRLVMDLDGRPTARFMFFNGLSRTKKTGNISYLYNENQDANLAFSFQMQKKAAEYYPGLTRKIYLKGYRYNMHLRDKYLLIELGAQNNTLEEAMNACDPLAHILDMVLTGE